MERKDKEHPSVAHLSFSGDFGGREKVVLQLIRGMRGKGDPGLGYFFIEKRAGQLRNTHLLSALVGLENKLQCFQATGRFSPLLLLKMVKRLKEDGVYVAHCHCYKSLCYVLLARLLRLWRGRVCFTLHGLLLGTGFSADVIRLGQGLGMRMADGIIGCSEEILASSVPVEWQKKQVVIINAIETSFASYHDVMGARRRARQEIVARFNLREDDCIVINVGRLTAQKNFSLFLRLIEQRKKKGGDVCRYLIVGNGELHESLVAEAYDRKVDDRLVFTGFVQDMEQIYLGADLLVQTSVWEGTPMCLLEARSCALPVIAPDVGGNGGVITSGRDGFLYPEGDLSRLARLFEKYMQDKNLMVDHGGCGFNDTLARFTIDDWIKKHFRFYARLGK